MQQVAPEVISFVTNRSDEAGKESLNSPTGDRPLAKTFSESFMFEIDAEGQVRAVETTLGQASTTTLDEWEEDTLSDEESAVEKVVAGQRVCCAMCALHSSRSDEQVFQCWRAETTGSRFMRLRAATGVEHISIVTKRQSPVQTQETKGAWESPSLSHRATSPLESLAILGGRESDIVEDHDGTPKDPFPCCPGTPPRDSTSSRASSVCEIDLAMLDTWNLSAPEKKETPTTPKTSPSLENVRRMPRRSVVMLNSIRSKFMPLKTCAGVAI
ncbi:unnamed protein product [Phytophthora fragariaefolia]|uniref:Unnamed protein product n=1 Tax=Phytophthora fragariaefolia TaxID=1490495 RepID=A0A9W7CTK6_9STRA|nr:unnamed protein product [Phytophthora fragariaefolia]